MRTVAARSVSLGIRGVFEGPERVGTGLGHGYVDIGDEVVAFTVPGAPRMPNGIETDVTIGVGERCVIGRGQVRVRDTTIAGGPDWDPVPRPRVIPVPRGRRRPRIRSLVGAGPGLTPAGDDVLAGYVAGLVFFRRQGARARRIADVAARRTTALSASLLRHASRGELPEPAHAFLEEGDSGPLCAFGHTSGRSLMYGLALAAPRLQVIHR